MPPITKLLLIEGVPLPYHCQDNGPFLPSSKPFHQEVQWAPPATRGAASNMQFWPNDCMVPGTTSSHASNLVFIISQVPPLFVPTHWHLSLRLPVCYQILCSFHDTNHINQPWHFLIQFYSEFLHSLPCERSNLLAKRHLIHLIGAQFPPHQRTLCTFNLAGRLSSVSHLAGGFMVVSARTAGRGWYPRLTRYQQSLTGGQFPSFFMNGVMPVVSSSSLEFSFPQVPALFKHTAHNSVGLIRMQ